MCQRHSRSFCFYNYCFGVPKFIQIKRGIQIYNEGSYDLESLVKGSRTYWKTPEWGFPKGRRNYQENDLACALREFQEETGYIKDQ